MYFEQIRMNARKNRKDNGLFFGSLIIAIVSFYSLLSIEQHDIIRFLWSMERDALNKVLSLIPVVYVVSLFFVFFLVYFAYKYQLDNRKREFGLYLMHGMRSRRLFLILFAEMLWNSLLSLLLGLPVALLLTEMTSLLTARIVGIDFLGHQLTFSLDALLATIAGYLLVQVISMLILIRGLSKKELSDLLHADSAEKQSSISQKNGIVFLVIGIVLLLVSYALGISLSITLSLLMVLVILILGVVGTFFFYRGIGAFMSARIRKKSDEKSGLYTFTGRQIQESVISQYKALAIANLLILMSISCLSLGIGLTAGRVDTSRTADVTVSGEKEAIESFFSNEDTKSMVKTFYPMYISMLRANSYADGSPDENTHTISWQGMIDALECLPASEKRDNEIRNFSMEDSPYLIALSGYNDLLRSIGREALDLKENQVSLYQNTIFDVYDSGVGHDALKIGASVEIDGKIYELLPEISAHNLVADSKITLYYALVVPDALYYELCEDQGEPYCWNIILDDTLVKEKGLTQALTLFQKHVDGTGLTLESESYLTGIGRNLVYLVAGSYLTIYLGVLFLIIANTVIGLKYLIQQRSNKRRYLSLLLLGARTEDICQSAGKQIRTFFGVVIVLSSVSSIFAIVSMYISLVRLPANAVLYRVFLLTASSFLLFLVVESIYIFAVQRIGKRELRELSIEGRRE
jgi:putative ABC transport system permease protein